MCDIDVDSITTYLSQKLNRIFYDREFVSYVNEDLQLLLNKKNKCALVFPVLEPVFLKAVYFQAKFHDLGVFHVGFGRKRSVVICHKEYLQEKSEETLNVIENSPVAMSKENVCKHNTNKAGRKPRPTLQLYVPPAQRAKKNSIDNKPINKQPGNVKLEKCNGSNEIITKPKNFNISTDTSPEQSLLTVIQNENAYRKDTIIINNRIESNVNEISAQVDDSNAQNNINKKNQTESLNNVQYIMQLLINKIEEVECINDSPENLTVKDVNTSNNSTFEILNDSNSKRSEISEENKFADDKNGLVIKATLPKKNDEMDKEKEEMRRAQNKINRTRPIMKYIDIDNDTLHIDHIQDMKSCKHDLNYEENLTNWEDMFNDDGEIKEKFAFEITKHMGNDTKVFKVSKDYSPYQGKIEDLDHVIEIYDFPPMFQTHDIMQLFYEVSNETMYVKWVDNTHALLVLSTPAKAQRALQVQSELIKTRPLCDASSISIETAYKSDLKPAMKRPQTNLLTARRMINSHLGTKSRLSKETMEHEKKLLREAREQRRLEKQNERDAWEGNPRPSTA